jgi:hypothetical protein
VVQRRSGELARAEEERRGRRARERERESERGDQGGGLEGELIPSAHLPRRGGERRAARSTAVATRRKKRTGSR